METSRHINKDWIGFSFVSIGMSSIEIKDKGVTKTYFGDPPYNLIGIAYNICPVCGDPFQWAILEDDKVYTSRKKITLTHNSKVAECAAIVIVKDVYAQFAFRWQDVGVETYSLKNIEKLGRLWHPSKGAPKAYIYRGKCL